MWSQVSDDLPCFGSLLLPHMQLSFVCLSESGICSLSLIRADYSNATDAIKIEIKAEIEPKQFGIN